MYMIQRFCVNNLYVNISVFDAECNQDEVQWRTDRLRTIRTIPQWAHFPDGDRALRGELTEGQLEEEDGKTSDQQHNRIGHQERTWRIHHRCIIFLIDKA